MIPGGTCENGITVLFSVAGVLHIWIVDKNWSEKHPWLYYTSFFFFLPCSSNKNSLYGFLLSSVACLYANMPNVPVPFMKEADFLVANVMFSSILPARRRAVKLFQSAEVNSGEA